MKTRLSFLFAFLLLSVTNSLRAQGTAFSYGGQLNTGNGPANGLYDFQFSLSNAPSGGSQVGGALTLPAVGVTNGVFTVTLDFGAVFTGNPIWLAIAVRTNGSDSFTNLAPLQPVLATPYAIYAASAGSATGLANGVAIGAGQYNAIDPSAALSFIGGGNGNNIGANSGKATIVGGGNNVIQYNNADSAIGGGEGNMILRNSLWAVIGGGSANIANGEYATVGGGNSNAATNNDATVAGGDGNTAGGAGATVAGGQGNSATDQFTTVAGGLGNTATVNAATVGGGDGNHATDQFTTVAGGEGNSATVNSATVGGGGANTASFEYATVAGGQGNNATFDNSTVGGGLENTASGEAAVVGGGDGNIASGAEATVGGGENNKATSSNATVPGGFDNIAGGASSFAAGQQAQATNDGAFVWSDDEGLPFNSTNNNSFNVRAIGGVRFVTGGTGMTIDGAPVLTGTQSGTPSSPTFSGAITAPDFLSDSIGDFVAGIGNTASSGEATVGGGQFNKATSQNATVAGGANNMALAQNATVAGGDNNTASGNGSAIGGGSANTASGKGDFIGGGGYDGTTTSGNSIQANAAAIGGGLGNAISSDAAYGFIGGGQYNTNEGYASTIGGGSSNVIGNLGFGFNVVGGGSENTNFGGGATVGGGQFNAAYSYWCTVGGGENNIAGVIDDLADFEYATVGGGANNLANGPFSTVPGGLLNIASGGTSFAAGFQAQALHKGAFVWADSQYPTFTSTGNDQFLIRAQGGVGVNTASPQQALSVVGGMNIDQAAQNTGAISANALTFGSASGEGIASKRSTGGTQYDLEFYTGFANRMTIFSDGGVGIHTNSDDGAALNVNGTVQASNPGGSALTIGAGAITVAGAGQNTGTAAFIQTVTADNIPADEPAETLIDNPLCNNDPNAMLFITYSGPAPGGNSSSGPFAVVFGGVNWFIYPVAGTGNLFVGETFNVLIVKAGH